MATAPVSDTPKSARTTVWILAAIAAAVFAVGVYAGTRLFATSAPDAPPDIGGVYIDPPLDVVDFSLTRHDGGELTPASFKDRWTLIYFGYTFCPDACPLTLAQVKKMQDLLAAQNADADNHYLLISVDPARDTPERLGDYVRSFHEKFSGATGEREQIDRLTESMGIFYQIHEPAQGEDFYLVDHSSALVLVNPDAKVQAVLTPPFTPQGLAEDLNAVKARRDS